MKYTKKFKNHSQYETYINSEDFVKPNLSVCKTNNIDDNHFHKKEIKKLKCIYDVSNISINTILMDNTHYQSLNGINKMYIDKVEVPKTASYKFSSLGEHIVEYDLLYDPQTYALPVSFNDCKALTEITIPDKCRSFHTNSSTFQNAWKLRKIHNIHKDFNPIPYLTGDDFCFTSIETINIPLNNPYLDTTRHANAFIDPSTHKLIVGGSKTIIPGDVSVIGKYALQGRSETIITIPKNIKEIKETSFTNIANTSIHIYGTCKRILNHAFMQCSQLTDLILDEGIEFIGNEAFLSCNNLTGTLVLPGSLNTIEPATFKYTGLQHIKVSEGTTKICYGAFNAMTSLISVDLPSTIQHIGAYSAYSYTSEAGWTFYGDNNLISITCRAITPPTLYSSNGNLTSNFSGINENCKIYVPANSVNAYKAASGWSSMASVILPIPE